MKIDRHLLKYSLGGLLLTTMASLAYLFLGSWGFSAPSYHYSPDSLPARIIFYPGVQVGNWCYGHISYSVGFCKTIGVMTMSVLGVALGVVLSLLLRKRKAGGEPNAENSVA